MTIVGATRSSKAVSLLLTRVSVTLSLELIGRRVSSRSGEETLPMSSVTSLLKH
jgi:hypothetical protein